MNNNCDDCDACYCCEQLSFQDLTENITRREGWRPEKVAKIVYNSFINKDDVKRVIENLKDLLKYD